MMMPDANLNIVDDSGKNVYEVADKYDELFPPLPNMRDECEEPVIGQWTQKIKIRPSIIKQVFCIPEKDKKYQDVKSHQFDEQELNEQCKIFIGIMKKTGTYIKTWSCMDQNLNISITGKIEEVLEAQWLIIKELAKQVNVAIPVPKEHHEFILGKYGRTLDYLQLITVTKIFVPHSSDNLNFIVITGTKDGIDKAAQEIELISDKLARSISIPIPKKHHRSILEKIQKRLSHWELVTITKITVLRPEDNSDMIMVKITGTEDGLEKAGYEIELILDEQAKLAFECVSIPKVYHPFIFGPFNEIVNQIMYETGARINIPPLSVNKNELTIDGAKDAVKLAKNKILKIYKERRQNCVVISAMVPKSNHQHVIGPDGQTIEEILAKTGVSVEVPPADSQSEIITLRGVQAKLQSALSLVHSKACNE